MKIKYRQLKPLQDLGLVILTTPWDCKKLKLVLRKVLVIKKKIVYSLNHPIFSFLSLLLFPSSSSPFSFLPICLSICLIYLYLSSKKKKKVNSGWPPNLFPQCCGCKHVCNKLFTTCCIGDRTQSPMLARKTTSYLFTSSALVKLPNKMNILTFYFLMWINRTFMSCRKLKYTVIHV